MRQDMDPGGGEPGGGGCRMLFGYSAESAYLFYVADAAYDGQLSLSLGSPLLHAVPVHGYSVTRRSSHCCLHPSPHAQPDMAVLLELLSDARARVH